MHFEWDAAKAESNFAKHRLSFENAVAIFLDPNHVVLDTVRVDDGENRQKAIGSIGDRLFTIVFTIRGSTCRLISARRSNVSEKRRYDSRHIGSP